MDILEGQHRNPVRVPVSTHSKDVSTDVGRELRQRCDLQMQDVPFFLQDLSTAAVSARPAAFTDARGLTRPPGGAMNATDREKMAICIAGAFVATLAIVMTVYAFV